MEHAGVVAWRIATAVAIPSRTGGALLQPERERTARNKRLAR